VSFTRMLLNIASALLKKTITVIGGSKSAQISAHLANYLIPYITQQTKFGPITFFCPDEIPEWRARTLLTKEPETIAWIDSFDDGDVLWDIGANVGVYSLYAATKGHTVLAFEPAPGNYYVLNRNIEINKLDDKISAYCVALNDKSHLDTFFMENTALGEALNSFGEMIDWKGLPLRVRYRQAMIGFSIDDFVNGFYAPFPNHIKIDVDGIENKIIKGAMSTLSDDRLKSVLVELDTDRNETEEVIEVLKNVGLHLGKKAHGKSLDNTRFAGVYNYIFERNSLTISRV